MVNILHGAKLQTLLLRIMPSTFIPYICLQHRASCGMYDEQLASSTSSLGIGRGAGWRWRWHCSEVNDRDAHAGKPQGGEGCTKVRYTPGQSGCHGSGRAAEERPQENGEGGEFSWPRGFIQDSLRKLAVIAHAASRTYPFVQGDLQSESNAASVVAWDQLYRADCVWPVAC